MRRLSPFRLAIVALWLGAGGCSSVSKPVVAPDRTAEFTETCRVIWLLELGRPIDISGAASCLDAARRGMTAEQITAVVRDSNEYAWRQEQLDAAKARWNLESGWLARNADDHLVNEAGTKWRGVGSSDFLLFQRFTRGEDLTPVLEQRRDLGFNYLRVFGMFDGALGRFHVDETPNYFAQLGAFLDLVAGYGLRVEVVVFADAQRAMSTGQALHLWAVASVLDKHWNALGELCNECAQNGVDPLLFNKPAGRTLWSRGSNCCGDDGYIDPPWDYVTHHAARDEQWVRKAECRPIRDASGRDCLEDEPMGASAVNQPGRRSNNPVDFGQAGMLFGLVTSGGLFHSDSGILSQPFSDVELVLAQAFVAGLTFPPVAAMLASYQRGNNCGDCAGVGDMPLQQLDAHELRTFCKRVIDEYCVVIRSDRSPLARAGWRVIQEPLPGLLRLTQGAD